MAGISPISMVPRAASSRRRGRWRGGRSLGTSLPTTCGWRRRGIRSTLACPARASLAGLTFRTEPARSDRQQVFLHHIILGLGLTVGPIAVVDDVGFVAFFAVRERDRVAPGVAEGGLI